MKSPSGLLHRMLPAFAAIISFQIANASPSEKPNIIFILADDLGWSDVSFYGNTKLYQTPNLERLAKRGVVFSRAYSASPNAFRERNPKFYLVLLKSLHI